MTLVRRQYRVGSASVDEINFVFGQLADRLDQMEGWRGTPEFQADVDMGGHRGTNAANAVEDTDLLTRLGVTGIDHGVLGGLTDDDHTQYALLAGRGTGQTLVGGINSGNNLILQSTAHATRGSILFGNSSYDEVNNRLGIGTSSPDQALDVTGHIAMGGAYDSYIYVTLASGTNGSALYMQGTGTANMQVIAMGTGATSRGTFRA